MAKAVVRSKAVVLMLIHCLLLFSWLGFCVSGFVIQYCFAIMLMGKNELVALL